MSSATVAEVDRIMHASSELALTSTHHAGSQALELLRAHIAAALAHLSCSKPSATRIHGARKELKRARATLRLVREAVDPNLYHKEDAELRRAARMLNDVRDAEVLLRTFSRLRTAIKESKPAANLQPLRKILLEERRRASAASSSEQLRNARAVLMQSKDRTHEWLVANDMDLLSAGVRRTYRKGRFCYRAACELRSDQRLHAWRRQVKYGAYQLEAIRSISSAKMTRRLHLCTRLADLLGRDHDLAMLRERAAAADLDVTSALRCADAIRHQRARLQRKAFKVGARLYRIRPGKFRQLVRQSSATRAARSLSPARSNARRTLQ